MKIMNKIDVINIQRITKLQGLVSKKAVLYAVTKMLDYNAQLDSLTCEYDEVIAQKYLLEAAKAVSVIIRKLSLNWNQTKYYHTEVINNLRQFFDDIMVVTVNYARDVVKNYDDYRDFTSENHFTFCTEFLEHVLDKINASANMIGISWETMLNGGNS